MDVRQVSWTWWVSEHDVAKRTERMLNLCIKEKIIVSISPCSEVTHTLSPDAFTIPFAKAVTEGREVSAS